MCPDLPTSMAKKKPKIDACFFLFFFFAAVIAATPQLTTQLLRLIKVRTTEPTRVPKTQNSTINQPIPPITFLKAQADPDFNKT